MADADPPRRSPRTYLVAAVALVAVAVGAVVYASRTDPRRLAGAVDPGHLPVGAAAPGLAGATGWLNSPPLAPADLAGKVVVYDFWTYSCVNCVRTLPYVRAWYQRYQADGLVVVGVHSPEFDFEKVPANVAAAVTRLGVTWPVALDPDHAIWDRFANNYWPAKYVADRSGRLRYHHFGEGDYATGEDVLRSLLGVDPSSPRAAAPGATAPTDQADTSVTAETYLGLARGDDGVRPGRSTYDEPGPLAPGDARLAGDWTAAQDDVVAGGAGSAVVLAYRAKEVNLVLAPPPDGPVDVEVTLDGQPLPAADRTADTVVEADGTTVVHVDRSDMFRLVLGPAVEVHTLRLSARSPGVAAFAFTFG
ncbi:MAG: redoxin domain-containing protein [Acidimicrobiales bacterium]